MEFIGGEAHEFGAAEGRREAARLVKAQVGESLHADQWQQVVRFQNYCMQKELGRSGSNDNNERIPCRSHTNCTRTRRFFAVTDLRLQNTLVKLSNISVKYEVSAVSCVVYRKFLWL